MKFEPWTWDYQCAITWIKL